ncbi:MAG: T9SS type A sorting domain-containing protein, partial [Bacteroidetes bacterium]|nr:T9SS type A sorting domain-containing protein [Bacteroidota bacterium]
FYDADVDQIHQKIYFAHYWGIYSMNYDGSAFDTLVYSSSGGYSDGVAVDAVGGYVYWSAKYEYKIYRSDLNGDNITTIFNTTGYPTDVDLDLVNNKIYFGQWFTGARGLYSIDLNGTNLNTIITSGYDVHFIGLDLVNSKIYFSDDAQAKCRRVNFNGTNDTLIYNFQAGGFFVDAANSLLYTSNTNNNNIVVSNLNGGNSSNIFPPSTLAAPFGPLLFSICTPITFSQSPTICTGQSITVGNSTYTTSGTYIDTLTAVNTCDSIVTTNLTVNPMPDLSTTLGGVIITANQNGGTYQWIDCSDSSAIGGATNQSYTATTNGNYAVIITLNSCLDTSLCVNVNTVGIVETAKNNQLAIYPNPFSSQTVLQTDNIVKNATLTVYNSFGQIVKQIKNISGQTIIFHRDNLSSGLYFIQLTEENTIIILNKLVIID